MDSKSNFKDPKYLRFNATDYLKQDIDLSAKNSEDCDTTQLNKSKFLKSSNFN